MKDKDRLPVNPVRIGGIYLPVDEIEKSKDAHRRLKEAIVGPRSWLLIVALFILLCFLTWVNEFFDIYHLIIGVQHTPVDWHEAASETVIIISVGFFVLLNIIGNIKRRKHAEEELRKYHERLEEMVNERTARLKHMVDAMALRVSRVADLEIVIQKLSAQIKKAGLIPLVDDPLSDDPKVEKSTM